MVYLLAEFSLTKEELMVCQTIHRLPNFPIYQLLGQQVNLVRLHLQTLQNS
jgi:hypothetical protein